MKLTKKLLTKLVEEVLNEQPPKPPVKPAQKGGEDETTKKLKIDIPASPFEPDVNQVKDRLKQILKQWEVKKYSSDVIRWKSYYNDISELVKKLEGEQ